MSEDRTGRPPRGRSGGGTTPVGGVDRTNDPQAEAAQQPGGGGAPGTGQPEQRPATEGPRVGQNGTAPGQGHAP